MLKFFPSRFRLLSKSLSEDNIPYRHRIETRVATSILSTKDQLKSIWQLGGLTPIQLTKRVWHEIDDDDLLGRSSELAYNFILALFPALLFLIALFGLFASRGSDLRGHLLFYFSQILPPTAFDLVNRTITEVSQNSGGGKLTFGILVTLWFASRGTSSMMSALNVAYGVREKRSWIKTHLISVGLTAGISILVTSALAMILIGPNASDAVGSFLHLGSAFIFAWKVVQYPAALFSVVLAFSLIYYFGPDLKEQHWYWITPGSVAGVLLWLAASSGFRLYLHYFNSYSKTYGSLGAVMILLVWFYVTGLAFLLGAEVNSEIEHAAADRGHPEAKAEGQKAAA